MEKPVRTAIAAVAAALVLVGCGSADAPPIEADVAPSQTASEMHTETAPADVEPPAPDPDDVTLDGSVDEVGSDAWWADTAVMSWWGNLSEEDEQATCDLAAEHGTEDTARTLARIMNRDLADSETAVDVPTLHRWLTEECG